MRIMLACALGMSTGMLVERMREAAASQGKDYKIWAVDVATVDRNVGEFDVLLLGPQVTYLLSDMQAKYEELTPVAVIKPVDYGRMNGKAVLKFAEDLLEAKNK